MKCISQFAGALVEGYCCVELFIVSKINLSKQSLKHILRVGQLSEKGKPYNDDVEGSFSVFHVKTISRALKEYLKTKKKEKGEN
ncbi:CLUMA_CG021502, isoform A [Clunio marinus]|uniref:CLUMA_CG021502, isoform A n=1 Tax=Clunio marinus TaxID=568069 RepID=A0A1J1J8X7_9DIPT|nr:CLUMA_CG021502, isoform A [Clunio marinus]